MVRAHSEILVNRDFMSADFQGPEGSLVPRVSEERDSFCWLVGWLVGCYYFDISGGNGLIIESVGSFI